MGEECRIRAKGFNATAMEGVGEGKMVYHRGLMESFEAHALYHYQGEGGGGGSPRVGCKDIK